ncbi:MAG: SDR family oxidoreductase [Burkholderiaceae bacterium]|nr:SDR family oxidoreductase [Burkholderiaceae bacterium]MDO9088705.1 SDR family oxidoreductase [Burkholderiaceae bacterium]
MKLSETVSIVTGGAGGIGREIVTSLLNAGARVLAVDASQARLDAMQQDLGHAGARLACLTIDQTRAGSGREIVQAALKAFGAFNVLISNAGVGRQLYTKEVLGKPPRVWEVPAGAWDTMFSINALAAIHLINEAMPVLLAQPHARLIAVTTSLNSMLNAGTGPYGPSKAALEAYVAVLSDELAGTGVTANVLVPGGVVDTAMIPVTAGVDRDDMLKPAVMLAPLHYLLSDAGDVVTARRFRANLWDASIAPAEALARAGAPIAWTSISAGQRLDPPKKK